MAGTPASGPPVETRDDLVAYLEQGCKPPGAWRIGTEHEKIGFRLKDLTPLPYDGPDGIETVLTELSTRFGWERVLENGKVIALKGPINEGSISLEPGGQLELSGAPLNTLHETCAEVHSHLDQVRAVARDLDIGFLGVGFSPKWTLAETPGMPKGRYDIMTRYMAKVGTMGLDMMYRSCTIQVNLDFASETDMVKKMRVGLALQPVATALFANSPFTEGRPNGFLSFRSEIWRHTDADRTGMLPFVFEDGMGFERYTDYALDVPMYFVYRDGAYIDAAGQSFRDFMEGRLPALPGETPTVGDWVDHLTTIFPEVRLKRFLEMRGADGGPWSRLCALPAFWVGLLYDQSSLDAAWDLVKDWTDSERQELRDQVPRTALKTPFRDGTVRDLAIAALAIARNGLANRNRLNNFNDSEEFFLSTLQDIAGSGTTLAEDLLSRYRGPWQGKVDPIFSELAY